jgi:RNA polymerase sigma-70 factor (ECF subfamily)
VAEPQTPLSRQARFDTLFIENQRAVLRYAMRRTESAADAEDVAAETFTICWRRLEVVPVDQPLPWLYAVARRVLANQRRGRGRLERLISVLRSPDVATPAKLGDDLDTPVFHALASLSRADQELLRLVAWEELGHAEIAQVLGISSNAVAIRLHRARARFAEALKGLVTRRTHTDVTGTDRVAWKGEAL